MYFFECWYYMYGVLVLNLKINAFDVAKMLDGISNHKNCFSWGRLVISRKYSWIRIILFSRSFRLLFVNVIWKMFLSFSQAVFGDSRTWNENFCFYPTWFFANNEKSCIKVSSKLSKLIWNEEKSNRIQVKRNYFFQEQRHSLS